MYGQTIEAYISNKIEWIHIPKVQDKAAFKITKYVD